MGYWCKSSNWIELHEIQIKNPKQIGLLVKSMNINMIVQR